LDNNVTYERDGIAIQQMHNGTASGFIVMGNTCTKNMNAIWMAVSNSMISNNILTGNNEGVDITGTGNTIKSNIITNNTSVGIALTTQNSTDSNSVSNNILSGNGGNYYTAGPGTVIGE
jgi:parallel beta-helix repeat protein